mgnify:CR=1 FL=1
MICLAVTSLFILSFLPVIWHELWNGVVDFLCIRNIKFTSIFESIKELLYNYTPEEVSGFYHYFVTDGC